MDWSRKASSWSRRRSPRSCATTGTARRRLGSAPPAALPTHLILLVDVSESMDVLVRRDPNAQKVGAASAEGKAAQRVVSDVPSRREMAVGVVQKMVERLHGDDLLTLIAF